MISLNLLRSNNILIETLAYNNLSGGERGDLPCIGHVGMCGPKGYGFCSRFGHNRVSNLAIFVSNGVWILHFSIELDKNTETLS